MSYIKIIRLKRHEDIISFVAEEKGLIKLTHPVSLYITYNVKEEKDELILSHWIPKQLVKRNETFLSKSNILCSFDPTETFKEYYLNFLNGFESIEDLTENKDEIANLLSSLDAKAENKLH